VSKLSLAEWLQTEEAVNHRNPYPHLPNYVRAMAEAFKRQRCERLDMLAARNPLAFANVQMHYAAYLERADDEVA
jgi:hypothetical protein